MQAQHLTAVAEPLVTPEHEHLVYLPASTGIKAVCCFLIPGSLFCCVLQQLAALPISAYTFYGECCYQAASDPHVEWSGLNARGVLGVTPEAENGAQVQVKSEWTGAGLHWAQAHRHYFQCHCCLLQAVTAICFSIRPGQALN